MIKETPLLHLQINTILFRASFRENQHFVFKKQLATMLLQWPVTLLSREPGAAMQRILKARLQRDMFSLLICLPTLSHIRLNIYYYYSAPSLHSRYFLYTSLYINSWKSYEYCNLCVMKPRNAIGNALTCTGGHYYHIQIRLGSNEVLLMSNRHIVRTKSKWYSKKKTP